MKLFSKHRVLLYNTIFTIVLAILFYLNIFSRLELWLQDSLFQEAAFVDPNISIVRIDTETLTKFGRFQGWSRQIMADAINILNSDEEYKPAVIAVDMLFSEHSENKEADENLAKAAKDGGNVVIATEVIIGFDDSPIDVVLDYLRPYPLLEESVDVGLVNGTIDSDNIVRSALLKLDYKGEDLYSFPLSVYRKYTGDNLSELTEHNNEVYITYYGYPGEYSSISFAEIFDEDFDPSYFADCIVMIGAYANGLRDSYYTPITGETQMYGVEIHANVLQMLLEKNFKQRISFAINFAIFLSVIVIAFIVSKLVDIRILLVIFIVFSACYFFLALWIFKNGYIITLIYPIFALGVIYVYKLIYGYVLEALEKQKIKGAFKKYVDPKLVDKLMETGEANSNEVGVLKSIAVLFVDIRGFTPMAEALKDKPDLIVKILNEYLELTSKAVFDNGGSVDKFIGDATMALFNGFVPLEDYVFRAVKAAWDIVQGASAVNTSIKEKYNVDVGFGVGVNCGNAIVGNLGPSFRKDYTAIGDTVNIAARLESNAKRSEVLISKNVYELVKNKINAVSVGEIPLKGKSEKLEVFSILEVKAV